jgi:prepilin-type N-terminal cleavage/methylation domain-containing protein
MRKATSTPGGFTLVELLVVIGIIALLISILMPSLNRARQAAQSVQCLSNLRQLYFGVRFYADDNKGCFPAAPVNHYQWPVPRMLGRDSEGHNYIKSPNVWACPSDATDQINTIPGGYSNQFIGGGNISYAYNQTCGMMDNQSPRISGGPFNNFYPCFPSYRPEKSKSAWLDPIFFDVEAGTVDAGQNWTYSFMWGRLDLCTGASGQTGSQLYSGRHMNGRYLNLVAGDGHSDSIDLLSIRKKLHSSPPSTNSQARTLLWPWRTYAGDCTASRVN